MRSHRHNPVRRRHGLLRLTPILIIGILIGSIPARAPAQEAEAEDRARVREAIDDVKGVRLRMGKVAPHEIARGIFAFGKDLRVYEKKGDTFVPAVEYLLREATYKGKRVFYEKDGEVRVLSAGRDRGKIQDLPDEILMILALSGVSLDEEIVISKKKKATVRDLLETAKKRIDPSRELSCSMVAFAAYLPWGEAWEVPKSKKKVTVERLIKASLQKNPAAHLDSGAHHLFALSYLLRKWRQEGDVPEAIEKAIVDRLTQRRNRMKSQQTGSGSLGFLGVKALETTGRHLHWIVISDRWDQVHQPWVDRAALWLAEDLRKAVQRRKPGYGTLALAARALSKYSDLRFPGPE